jgi:hypothetical protein
MELQTWVDFMELWVNLICSWVASTTCSLIEILKKKNMCTNLQITWEEQFLKQKDIWEPICRKLEEKTLEQIRNGYPFAKKLKRNIISGCNTQPINLIKQD